MEARSPGTKTEHSSESVAGLIPARPGGSARFVAIDALRGLVIVLMALDHSRDFFGDLRIRPEEVATTTTVLFFTRWVTHFCAPTFVLLAGVSAWMYGRRLQTRGELSRYLITRGAWLVVIEFTLIYFGLYFTFSLGAWTFLVIAAIGVSMMLLGLICWLPHPVVLAIGIAITCGHNLFDSIDAESLGNWNWVWVLLHQRGYIEPVNLLVGYPVLPWFGVMAIGYGMGPYLSGTSSQRRRFALVVGTLLIIAFVLLRGVNQYGDSQRWNWQSPADSIIASTGEDPASAGSNSFQSETPATIDWTRTLFSFLATTKYPPSLLFVLMTIGPALVMLAGFEWLGENNPVVRFLNVFGRVPLFFYVLHFYLLHLGALALYWITKGVWISPMRIDFLDELPLEYGFNGPGWLIQVYVAWIVVLAILFPACVWYGKAKRRGKSWLWSYF